MLLGTRHAADISHPPLSSSTSVISAGEIVRFVLNPICTTTINEIYSCAYCPCISIALLSHERRIHAVQVFANRPQQALLVFDFDMLSDTMHGEVERLLVVLREARTDHSASPASRIGE